MQVRKRAQKCVKERKRALPRKNCKRARCLALGPASKAKLRRKNCKQTGLKQPGLGTPMVTQAIGNLLVETRQTYLPSTEKPPGDSHLLGAKSLSKSYLATFKFLKKWSVAFVPHLNQVTYFSSFTTWKRVSFMTYSWCSFAYS